MIAINKELLKRIIIIIHYKIYHHSIPNLIKIFGISIIGIIVIVLITHLNNNSLSFQSNVYFSTFFIFHKNLYFQNIIGLQAINFLYNFTIIMEIVMLWYIKTYFAIVIVKESYYYSFWLMFLKNSFNFLKPR